MYSIPQKEAIMINMIESICEINWYLKYKSDLPKILVILMLMDNKGKSTPTALSSCKYNIDPLHFSPTKFIMMGSAVTAVPIIKKHTKKTVELNSLMNPFVNLIFSS